MKPLCWVGSALSDLRGFPEDVRSLAGHNLHLVQMGFHPTDWKPMATVGSGVFEIRIHAANEYRVLYVAKFEEAVYVLHCFEKKTQKTAARDLELARSRYQSLLATRRRTPR